MKKFNLFLTLIAVVMLVGLTNCTKKEQNAVTPKYVGTVNGSFNVQDGNITFKSFPASPIGANRTWTMLRKSDGQLVDGTEFITGSAAQIWWSPAANNNPVTFPAAQTVYSNLTPAEPLRLITETKDANNNVAYLGVLDFDPTQAQFPLTVNGFRLGDVLQINTDALTALPGGASLTFTATFNVKLIDETASKTGYISPATGGAGAGVTGEFGFADIKYGALSSITVPITAGDCNVYNDLLGKVTGSIVITINEPASSSTPAHTFIVTIPDSGNSAAIDGKGRLFKLQTSKVGWYDSANVTMTDNDITFETVFVTVN